MSLLTHAITLLLALGIQRARITNEHLYFLVDNSQPISSIVRERQLRLIGHYLRMEIDERSIYAHYVFNIAASHRRALT